MATLHFSTSISHNLCPLSCTVMLQAMKEEPPLNAKCKDKFLVQSTAISPDKETMSLHDFVRDISFPFMCLMI